MTSKLYHQIHHWLRKYKNKSVCEHCGCDDRRLENALKKGFKYDFEVDNFLVLCVSCHRKYDYTEARIKKMRATKTGMKHSDSTRSKISQAMTGENNHRYGVKFSDETRAKMRLAAKNRKTTP